MTKQDDSDLTHTIRLELHELSQPLTTLRCRLELALMVSPPLQKRERASNAEVEEGSLHDAVQGAIGDLSRVFLVVERMRKSVLARVSK